jgi:hypothetical protein
MKKLLAFALLLSLALSSFSQEEINEADTLRKDALNVYMDASSYLKERITFINYVRDRKVADLVIVTTSDRTGSGGRVYTMFLEGQGRFAGMIDTLKYNTSPDETHEMRREKQVKTLKMGLIRYIIKTPLAQYLDIKFTEPISSEVSTDKWNSWVFRTNLSGWSDGETSQKDFDMFGGASASKITDDWKFNLSLNFSYGNEKYTYDDVVYESIKNSRYISSMLVKSLTDHWSVGGSYGVYSSTYANYDLKAYITPGIEYNVFPYSESTTRQFRFLYRVGYTYNDYIDSTIYDITKEQLFSHSLSSSYEVIKKWGSIDLSLAWSNYLRDFSENELSLHGSIEWKIAKGLSVEAGGAFSFINNQVNLAKGELTAEEILLQTQELSTDYSYYMHFGFSYTFGSIYNNVVNPRFGNSGRGRRIVVY